MSRKTSTASPRGQPALPPPPPLLRWPLEAHVEAGAWSPDGRRFAFGLADGRVCHGSLPGRGPLEVVVTGAEQVHRVWCAAGERGWWCTTDRRELLLVEHGAAPRLATRLDGGPGEGSATATDGRFAVASGREVQVFDADGTARGRLGPHPSTVASVAFSSQGRWLAAAHYTGVSVHDTEAPESPPRRLHYGGSHLEIAWSPDDAFIATGTQDKEVHVWRTSDGTDMRMSGYYAKVRSLSWSADRAWLLTSGGDAAVGWAFDGDGPEGRAPRMVGPLSEVLVTAVACHPSLPLVAIGRADGSVMLSSLGRRPLDVTLAPATGSPITQLVWAPGGDQLLGGCADGLAFVAPMDL